MRDPRLAKNSGACASGPRGVCDILAIAPTNYTKKIRLAYCKTLAVTQHVSRRTAALGDVITAITSLSGRKSPDLYDPGA